MPESLFEYITISLFIIVVILYLLRNTIREYFQPAAVVISPAKFSRTVKHGYITLLDLLYHNSNKDNLEKEIRYVAMQRSDGRYVGGYTKDTDEFDSVSFSLDYFYDLVNYTDARKENFILSLDRKSEIEDFNNLLKGSLGNLLQGVNLPHSLYYPDNATLSYGNLFSDYQKVLNEHNIQMAFLDEGSDNYYIVLHPLDKEKAVHKAVSDIGFEYTTILN